jgi:hypothetical protein
MATITYQMADATMAQAATRRLATLGVRAVRDPDARASDAGERLTVTFEGQQKDEVHDMVTAIDPNATPVG